MPRCLLSALAGLVVPQFEIWPGWHSCPKIILGCMRAAMVQEAAPKPGKRGPYKKRKAA
jgi:hypothetical protein